MAIAENYRQGFYGPIRFRTIRLDGVALLNKLYRENVFDLLSLTQIILPSLILNNKPEKTEKTYNFMFVLPF